MPGTALSWWRRALRYCTGGRPMQYLGYAFTDVVSGRKVGYYRDGYGRKWLAEHGWARFRVSATPWPLP